MNLFKKLENISLLLLILASASSQAANISFVPASPSLSAKSYVLLDYNSGKILASYNPDKKLPPASLTKMMTVYIMDSELAQGNINLQDKVTVSENAWAKNFPESSKMFIEPSKPVTVEQLRKGIIVQSGNDASVAIAEHIAGSEDSFVQLMNQYAKQLNLNDTHYVNSMGLPDPDHFSTAFDLSKLAVAIIRDFPDSYKLYAMKSYRYNGITQANRNRLLWDKSLHVDGLKTGHTKEAGYCLVSSAVKDNMRLVAVVMGTNSDQARKQESKKLLNWGFRFFRTVNPLPAGKSLHKMRVYYGDKETLDVGISKSVYLTLPRGEVKLLKAEFASADTIEAPVKKGQIVGKLFFKVNGKEIKTVPLVALTKLDKGGVFSRMGDWIGLKFDSWF